MLFVDDDCVFHRNSVIHTKMQGESINLKGLLRDLIVIIKVIYILLNQHGRNVIYQDAFILMGRLQWDDSSRNANRVAEEELEVGFTLDEEEEEKEFLFIFT